ncbi:hypothetical protein LSO9J_130022 [Candidatus Liberibacter solanacearum]
MKNKTVHAFFLKINPLSDYFMMFNIDYRSSVQNVAIVLMIISLLSLNLSYFVFIFKRI